MDKPPAADPDPGSGYLPEPLNLSGENNPRESPPPQAATAAAASPTGKSKKITEKEEDENKVQSTPTKPLLSIGSGENTPPQVASPTKRKKITGEPEKEEDDNKEPLTLFGENNPPEKEEDDNEENKGQSTPSGGENNPPPQVAKRKITGEEDGKKDDDDDKRPHAESESSKAKQEEEIEILKDILDYYVQNDTYPFAFSAFDDLSDFHETWSKDGRQKYPRLVDLDRKMDEMRIRFLNTFENYKTVGPTMDSFEAQIYELSQQVWGGQSWTQLLETIIAENHETTQESSSSKHNSTDNELRMLRYVRTKSFWETREKERLQRRKWRKRRSKRE